MPQGGTGFLSALSCGVQSGSRLLFRTPALSCPLPSLPSGGLWKCSVFLALGGPWTVWTHQTPFLELCVCDVVHVHECGFSAFQELESRVCVSSSLYTPLHAGGLEPTRLRPFRSFALSEILGGLNMVLVVQVQGSVSLFSSSSLVELARGSPS